MLSTPSYETQLFHILIETTWPTLIGGAVNVDFLKTKENNKMEKTPNHLINEKSPYLVQHAYNPVDWYPWGDEAIDKAKKENKPILLSIGYSTCHWCHVMEKESFENPGIAGIMNEHFVCIKVDREERPDLDAIYMTAATAISGSGGWPLNVFLTPDLKPFFAGTYFPAETKHQMTSWPDLLLRIAYMWRTSEEREKLFAAGENIEGRIKTYLAPNPPALNANPILDGHPVMLGLSHYTAVFDHAYGGFSPAPKFPSPVILNFLLACHTAETFEEGDNKRDGHTLNMVKKTLSAMADGGIYDQLGGGFHRYSTDRMWHIPHFEKMLYDNAQLIVNYIEMFGFSGDSRYRQIAESTADYVLRELRHFEGGFYSGEDADSPEESSGDSMHRKEGAFYVWEFQQVFDLLDQQSVDVITYYFGIKPDGNAIDDPHAEFIGKNILFKAHSLEETVKRFEMDAPAVKKIIENARAKLFSERNQRIRPHLDDKILTSWNGLMISALAKLYQATNHEAYRNAAVQAVEFIQRNLYNPVEKTLYRRWRLGERKIFGMAEDYAFLIQGLIDLYESDFQWRWLDLALELAEIQIRDFYDDDHGGFFMTKVEHDGHLIVRIKDEHDSVLPSANSISAINLLRLSRFFNREDLDRLSRHTIEFFLPKISRFPGAMPQMLIALQMALSKPLLIIVIGETASDKTSQMLKAIQSVAIPAKTVILISDPALRLQIEGHLPFVKEMTAVDGLPTAYICLGFRCMKPTTEPEKVKQLLADDISPY